MNMQKQFLALRLLYELINPTPKKYTYQQKVQVDKYFVENQIFYQIIQPNIHEQILLRSIELIKYLLLNNLISFKEIEYLWNIFPQTDVRGRATVQRMISQISKTFSIEYTKNFIDRILLFKESQLTSDNLSLLRSLKDHKQLTDQYRFKILSYLWELFTIKSMYLTRNIEQEIQKVFKAILPSLENLNYKLQLLNLILLRIKQVKQINKQFQILKQFILTYPKKSNNLQKIEQENNLNKVPQTVSQVIDLLKSKNIYQIIINIFNQLKNNEKMKNLLWFTSFMFQNDTNNVDDIAKVFYEKMGPSQIFLQWAQHITNKAHNFFVQMFEKIQDMNKFQKLNASALDALKAIIFDINIAEGNLKIVKKTKGIAIQSQPPKNGSSSQLTVQGNIQGPIQGPVQGLIPGPVQGPALKPETLTFLYLLKSPYECKGIKFLQQLLCVVKNNKVYDQIIKLIIQFFVNLDQSISNNTLEFRQQFLMDIISRIQQTIEKNQFNDKIKLKLQISINLLQTLFLKHKKTVSKILNHIFNVWRVKRSNQKYKIN